MKRCSSFMSVAVLACAMVGCGGGSGFPDPAPVEGSVSYKGKPVEGATVTFLAAGDGAGRSASGTTDASGKFQLTTFSTNDGALPGEYNVTIAKSEPKADMGEVDAENPGESYEQMMAAASSGSMAAMEKNSLPEKYSDASQSGLKRSVVEGQENKFDFDLE
ncbi:carboxypeptidase-like regulatory domain-containing protein [Roseimaritima ulvae]|uniref:Carboxypeptidase regulatory-like domain-containing protein n=1 Tax=Roseimaritima ulvae TaxID=980254 RepID=A0A5B9QHC1_9BACT|nr:carboxypeptidase-like regulatory domain-containing protein [Roseimaritima ulvae]QEG38224.1 hypothetical protein UC8_01790 [Roseimaritima ulvae]